MRQLARRLKVWLQCVWYLGATPRQLRLYYAELCLAVQTEPVEIAENLFLSGDQCTNVLLSEGVSMGLEKVYLRSKLAINMASYTSQLGETTLKGISIQYKAGEIWKWASVFRTEPAFFISGEWTVFLKRVLKAKVKARISPIPWTNLLRGFND